MITLLLEQALLEAETEVSVLKHRVVPAVVESTSSTNSHTDASTQEKTMPMRAQFTVSELEMMLREPLLTKGARLIERKGRQGGDGLALNALNVAKMLVAHSTVATVIFGAGCNGGIALFRKLSPPNFHARR